MEGEEIYLRESDARERRARSGGGIERRNGGMGENGVEENGLRGVE